MRWPSGASGPLPPLQLVPPRSGKWVSWSYDQLAAVAAPGQALPRPSPPPPQGPAKFHKTSIPRR
ncbi:hypothetical protein CGMCC3_g13742 [Colletotrichum fructicola]|nr:uncharacterized protein CGMCC3_g13742 [Colletotrichum fructicola]KAE9570156.1 hypothetical protein CGMCC3_g13742 [Colletotrichum fructicola]